MVSVASRRNRQPNAVFSISDAENLPYPSRYFDAVAHFGGINFFPNIKAGIAEMERVCKIGGTVLFGDEGIAPWLRDTDYARIAISNNKAWVAQAPSSNCRLMRPTSSWNTFWAIVFTSYLFSFQRPPLYEYRFAAQGNTRRHAAHQVFRTIGGSFRRVEKRRSIKWRGIAAFRCIA